jgi:hypothetical protein
MESLGKLATPLSKYVGYFETIDNLTQKKKEIKKGH